jgi:CRP-like cAMP-binding protein
MCSFIDHCHKLSPLPEEASADLLNKMAVKKFTKGDGLLKTGEVCRHIFYVEQGLVKTCFTKDYKEFIMRFFPEGSMFTVLDSYILQKPSTYMIIALEATTVSCISYNDLEDLCRKHHLIETFLRKLVSLASINMMKRISEMLEENATTRYNNFVTENIHLMQRISLGDLANYLGITQVSLSRIRGRK